MEKLKATGQEEQALNVTYDPMPLSMSHVKPVLLAQLLFIFYILLGGDIASSFCFITPVYQFFFLISKMEKYFKKTLFGTVNSL